MEGLTSGEGFKGVKDGREQQFSLENVKHKFQVFIFYPSDWDEESSFLLSSFSSLFTQFSSNECCVYGCSTDNIGSHLDMINTSLGSSLPFPLLSDPAGKLASRFSLFDSEERENMRAVVIADNMGIALEVFNTSMGDDEMAEYTLDLVKQILHHRSRLLHKTCRFQEPYHNPALEEKLEELAKYSMSVVKQAGGHITTSRERSASRYSSMARSMARSVSRGRSLVMVGESKQSYRDQSVVNKMKRTEDRMIRGYF